MVASGPAALQGYRVLDLTEGDAALGPLILADLGAEVIRVEPPGGSPSRRAAPVDPSLPAECGSLRFLAFNRNKRTVEIDLAAEAGREQLRRLVSSADLLFENAPPGELASRGLGFDDLSLVNPRLIYVAISPFGQDGPYRDLPASDLTLSALSGQMAVYGDADRPPVRISVPQAWLHGAAESAVAALVALQRRTQTGEAQFVDVSVQAALVLTAVNATNAAAVQGRTIERNGSKMALGLLTAPTVFPCADGYVVLFSANLWPKLVAWMVEDGTVPATWLTDTQWRTYFSDMLTGKPVAHSYEELVERAGAYVARHPAQSLFRRGLAEGVFIAPVNTVADVLSFDHLAARDYWQPLRLPEGRELRAPGPFVRLSGTPLSVRSAIPTSGEGNSEYLGDPKAAAQPPVRSAVSSLSGDGDLPFSGLKVADFSWVGVGPITGKYLADHGATTVRIETSSPPDILRVTGPFKDGVFGANRSHFYGMCNSSKWSLTLDLKHPMGRTVAKRLVQWADVCLESFTPGTMRDLGLDYETMCELNPSVIMVSTCLMGQSGPASTLAGYGTHASAISGFVGITGWPDRAPAGPYAAYTDLVAPRTLAASLMAALDYRRRTGLGQYIEQSQMEAALYFLAPELLDYQVSGTVPVRAGNASPSAAPHGVYPCAGEDQWCAIAVETDGQWSSLRALLGDPAWAAAPTLSGLAGRLSAHEEIDARLAEWTRTLAPRQVMTRLIDAGIPAGAVLRSSDLQADPQLAHRHFFRPLEHPEMGIVPYEGHQFRIRGYDSGPRAAAPCLGEHSLQVLQELLGMNDDEVAEVVTSGALV